MTFLVRKDNQVYTTDVIKEDEQVLVNPTMTDYDDWCTTIGKTASSGMSLVKFVELVRSCDSVKPREEIFADNLTHIIKKLQENFVQKDPVSGTILGVNITDLNNLERLINSYKESLNVAEQNLVLLKQALDNLKEIGENNIGYEDLSEVLSHTTEFKIVERILETILDQTEARLSSHAKVK